MPITIAPLCPKTGYPFRAISVAANAALRPLCAQRPDLFTDRRAATDAAAVCATCPLAGPCVAYATRLDAALRAGRDRYGVTGTFGGIWFEQGSLPVRVDVAPWRIAAAAEAAA